MCKILERKSRLFWVITYNLVLCILSYWPHRSHQLESFSESIDENFEIKINKIVHVTNKIQLNCLVGLHFEEEVMVITVMIDGWWWINNFLRFPCREVVWCFPVDKIWTANNTFLRCDRSHWYLIMVKEDNRKGRNEFLVEMKMCFILPVLGSPTYRAPPYQGLHFCDTCKLPFLL